MGAVKTALESIVETEKINRVLEVGVGRGDFLSVIVDCFNSDTHYIGIDTKQSHLDVASKIFEGQNVELCVMNGEKMEFSNDLFDIAFISNTLHHLPDPTIVLEEMKRVVKPGGYVVVHEMINENQSEKQKVHVWIHHLCADIDSALGVHHAHTYKKSEIKNLLTELDLSILGDVEYLVQDEQDIGDEKEILDNTFSALNKLIEKLHDSDIKETFRDRINQDKERVYETGFAMATEYLAITSINR